MENNLDNDVIAKPVSKAVYFFGFIAFLGLIILTPAGIYFHKSLDHFENGLMYIIQAMGILLIPFSLMLIFIILKRKMNKLLLIIPFTLLILPNAFFIFLAKTRLVLNQLSKRAGTIVPEISLKDFYIFEGVDKNKLDFDPEAVKSVTQFDCRTKWPGCITDVLDQGDCGTCWSYATTSVLADMHNIKKYNEKYTLDQKQTLPENDKIILSPQYLAECWKGYEGEKKCASGETVSKAMEYGKNIGSVPMGCKPLKMHQWRSSTDMCESLPCFGDCDKKCMDGKDAMVYKFKDVKSLSKNDSLENNILRIKHALQNNGPVVAGMIIYDNIPSGMYTGVYKGPKPDSQNLGGHAISIVGWGNNEEIGDYWIVRNSWSNVWGLLTDPGHFYVKMGTCSIENFAWTGTV